MSKSVSGNEALSVVLFKDSQLGKLPKEVLTMVLGFIPKEERLKAIGSFSCVAKGARNMDMFSGLMMKGARRLTNQLHRTQKGRAEAKLVTIPLQDPMNWSGEKFHLYPKRVLRSGYMIYHLPRSSHFMAINSHTREIVRLPWTPSADIPPPHPSFQSCVIEFNKDSFVVIEKQGVYVCNLSKQTVAYYRLVSEDDKNHIIAAGTLVQGKICLFLSKKRVGSRGVYTQNFEVQFDVQTRTFNKKLEDSLSFDDVLRPCGVGFSKNGFIEDTFNFIDGSELFFLPGSDFVYNIGESFDENIAPTWSLQQVERDEQISGFQRVAKERSKARAELGVAFSGSDIAQDRKRRALSNKTAKEAEFQAYNVGKRVYQLQSDGSKTLFTTVPCTYKESDAKYFNFAKNDSYLVCFHTRPDPRTPKQDLYIYDSQGNQICHKECKDWIVVGRYTEVLIKNDFLITATGYPVDGSNLLIFHIPTHKVLLDEKGLSNEEFDFPLKGVDLVESEEGGLELLFFSHVPGASPIVQQLVFTDLQEASPAKALVSPLDEEEQLSEAEEQSDGASTRTDQRLQEATVNNPAIPTLDTQNKSAVSPPPYPSSSGASGAGVGRIDSDSEDVEEFTSDSEPFIFTGQVSVPSISLQPIISIVVAATGGVFIFISLATFVGVIAGGAPLAAVVSVGVGGPVVGVVIMVAGGLLFLQGMASR